jgi:hypothetical protein
MVNKFPFPFFDVDLIFVIVDKLMYACSKCFDVVMGTSSCPFTMLFLSLKKIVIFLSSQPSPTLSVILLIVGMFPSENRHGQVIPEQIVGPRGASLAIFVSLAGTSRSIVAVGFDDAR